MIRKCFFAFQCLVICITFSFANNCVKSLALTEQRNINSFESADSCPCLEKYDFSIVSLLGVIQGITEFLPVSSTGHMVVVEHFFDKKNTSADTFSREVAMNSYFAIIQCGSILAIIVLYKRRIVDMTLGIFCRSPQGILLVRNLLVSFLPAGILGLFLDGSLQNILYTPKYIALALILGASLMLFAEKKYKNIFKIQADVDTLSFKTCIKIGLWQCLALIPGMSRSMLTIVGGYFCGLKKVIAVEYSFLLGLVTLTATTFFKLIKDYNLIFQYFDIQTFFLGIFVAFIFSMLAIKFLLTYISKHSLCIFVWYRLFLGSLILFLLK